MVIRMFDSLFICNVLIQLLIAFNHVQGQQDLSYFDSWSDNSIDQTLNDISGNDPSMSLMGNTAPADEPPKVFNIGAVLSREEQIQDFLQVIDSMYYEPNVLPAGLTLYPHTLPLQINPIKTVQGVCDKLIKAQVYVVLVSDTSSAESLAVTQTCGLYQIPVIGLSNRDSAMSDKHMHPVYMRTVPPFAHQVDVWIRILQNFEYRHVVFIHTDDYEGRSSVTRFQQMADKADIEVSHVIEYRPGTGQLEDQLAAADLLQARVYLLYAPEVQAQAILLEAQKLRLTGSGYVWLVAEQALDAPNIPDGALAVKLFAGRNSSAHIRDALFVIGLALREWTSVRPHVIMSNSVSSSSSSSSSSASSSSLSASLSSSLPLSTSAAAAAAAGSSSMSLSDIGPEHHHHHHHNRSGYAGQSGHHLYAPPPGYCGDHRKSAWPSGQRFYQTLRKQSLLYGRSGRVAFNGKGDRINADYDIVNINRGRANTVGSFTYNQAKRKMQLWINEQSIVWPGGLMDRPAGYVLPDQLRVVTLEEKPFVWARPVDDWKVENLKIHVRKVNHDILLGAGLRKNHSQINLNASTSGHSMHTEHGQLKSKLMNKNSGASIKNRNKSGLSRMNKNKNDHESWATTNAPDHGMLPGFDAQGRMRSKGSNTNSNTKLYQQSTSGHSNYILPAEQDESLDLPEDMLPGMLRFDTMFLQKELCERNELLCSKMDGKGKLKHFCCKGYCIDLLVELARRLNISFVLRQATDGQYGAFEPDPEAGGRRRWTGLIGELVSQQADMIVAPLTINPERSLYIDFSKPFKYQGITVIERQQTASRASLASFMEPFEDSLWIMVMVSVHVVALVLYLLDRFSPFGRYRLPNCDVTEEDALNLSSAVWFAWGVLLNSGIGEGTPRSFSGRVLGIVWAGFAMIIVASYTGNLAAFLVLNRPDSTLTGINDLRLRNPTDNYTYSTVKNSAVEMYFKRQTELANIYQHLIKNKPHYTVEEGIEAVKNNEIKAFIWDSARLEYEASQDCGLVVAAEQFGRSGYGIGLAKNSFWTEPVNQAVLSMHESGFMEKLDNVWILNENPECANRNNVRFPTTLGLRNMAGVFILVGAGIIGGIGLIVIEMIYKRQQNRKQRQLENARYAAEKWKKFVQRRRNYRNNAHQLRAIRMKHKMEQQHSQPSQESQQPLLAASPAAASLTGHHNPHLSLSKCNSGATDTLEVVQHPHPSDNAITGQTTSRQVNALDQRDLLEQSNKPEVPLSLHSLPPPPGEFGWPTQYNPYPYQTDNHLQSAIHSVPAQVLSRSALPCTDSGLKKKSALKTQKKNNAAYGARHQQPAMGVYQQADPITVSFESVSPINSLSGQPTLPVKPTRKTRAHSQLQHQQAIVSNENLVHLYQGQSPARYDAYSSPVGGYNVVTMDTSNNYRTSGPLRSALKNSHNSSYSVRQSSSSSSANHNYYDRAYRE